ncbi:MAG: VOC family protein [Chloroflexi bacterium]|nr:MAG: VOC family protein [Chloroflexota bacterium]
MFKVTKYPHGTFSWADCQSTDAAKAKQFYMNVMGWAAEDMPMSDNMVYTMFNCDGDTVSALNQMQPEMQEQGVPSHWNNYVTVDDVDAMVDKVKAAGGTIVAGPFDVFDAGRMMVIQDPTGAHLSLWQAKKHIGATLVNTVGAMSWNELHTHDKEAAQKFYSEIFGWEFHTDENLGYTSIMNKGRPNGGIVQLSEEHKEHPAAWSVYFTVANADETAEKIKAEGGKLLSDVFEIEGIGRFVPAQDPAGAHFMVFESSNPQPWEE